jgi:hypothetical protein
MSPMRAVGRTRIRLNEEAGMNTLSRSLIGVAALAGLMACSDVGQARDYLKGSARNSAAIRRP